MKNNIRSLKKEVKFGPGVGNKAASVIQVTQYLEQ